jgi:hypothetical protein
VVGTEYLNIQMTLIIVVFSPKMMRNVYVHYTTQTVTTLHIILRAHDAPTTVMAAGEDLDAGIWNPARACDACLIIPDA